MNSEKGLFFSIDALLALMLIVSASFAFLYLGQKTDSELLKLQNLRVSANDKAIVGFYLSKSGEFVPSSETYYCSASYSYDVVNNKASPKIYCGGS